MVLVQGSVRHEKKKDAAVVHRDTDYSGFDGSGFWGGGCIELTNHLFRQHGDPTR